MPRRCGGGFAEQVAGNVHKGEASTPLGERLEVSLYIDLDGFLTPMNLDANRLVVKIHLMAASVCSSNNGVRHIASL